MAAMLDSDRVCHPNRKSGSRWPAWIGQTLLSLGSNRYRRVHEDSPSENASHERQQAFYKTSLSSTSSLTSDHSSYQTAPDVPIPTIVITPCPTLAPSSVIPTMWLNGDLENRSPRANQYLQVPKTDGRGRLLLPQRQHPRPSTRVDKDQCQSPDAPPQYQSRNAPKKEWKAMYPSQRRSSIPALSSTEVLALYAEPETLQVDCDAGRHRYPRMSRILGPWKGELEVILERGSRQRGVPRSPSNRTSLSTLSESVTKIGTIVEEGEESEAL